MAFLKIGKGWENLDNISRIIPKPGGEGLNVVTRDNSKFLLAGNEAEAFLKACGVDAKQFWASAPKADSTTVVTAAPVDEPDGAMGRE